MNRRKIIISFILTFFILFIGFVIYKTLGKGKEILPPLPTQMVELRQTKVQQFKVKTSKNSIPIDGRLTPYESVNLSANVSGILKSNSKEIKKGMYFKKGDLLFDIDQRKAVFNLYAMRSNLMNAITQIMPDLKLDYSAAHAKWEEYLNDFDVEKNVNPLPKITDKKEKYFVGARNIHNQYYNIKSAEAQLLDYKIYAPFSGVITRVDVFKGAMVMPGQPLAMMINASKYELEAPIREEDIAAIKIGNSVYLESSSNNENWTGKIVRISNQIDPITQKVPVFISVSGKGLKEGMYLNGAIESRPIHNAVAIPREFIVNQEYVFVVQDSVLSLKNLEIKESNKEYVFAINFDENEWVVCENSRGLSEGQKVDVIQIKSSTK